MSFAHFFLYFTLLNRAIKHDFSFINIPMVLRELLKTGGSGGGAKPEVFNLPEGPCEC